MTTQEINRQFPVKRNYKAPEGKRNCSIAVFNDGSEQWGQFRICVSFEDWSGAEWIQVVQNDNAFSFKEACEKAVGIRDQFGWKR